MASPYVFLICFLLPVIVNGATNQGHCDQLFHPFGDKCYGLVRNSFRTWDQAGDNCWKYGGRLANGKTEDINKFLARLLRRHHTSYAWIGLEYSSYRNLWLWSDGDRVTFQNFQLSSYYQPRCAALDNHGKWHAMRHCNFKLPSSFYGSSSYKVLNQRNLAYICEVERGVPFQDPFTQKNTPQTDATTGDETPSTPEDTHANTEDEIPIIVEDTNATTENETLIIVEDTNATTEDGTLSATEDTNAPTEDGTLNTTEDTNATTEDGTLSATEDTNAPKEDGTLNTTEDTNATTEDGALSTPEDTNATTEDGALSTPDDTNGTTNNESLNTPEDTNATTEDETPSAPEDTNATTEDETTDI